MSVGFGIRHTELNALFGFAERQLHVVKRYWLWEVVWLFYSLVSVLSIGFLASGLGTLGGQNGSFDLRKAQLYLLIGALLWGYLSLVFMEAAYAIAWERWEGTIEYTFMAPVRRVTHLMGICLFAIGYGLIRTFVVLLIAAFMFKLDFSHADIPAALAVLAASTVPLIGLSIITSVLPLLSPQKGEQMSVALQGFLLLVAGADAARRRGQPAHVRALRHPRQPAQRTGPEGPAADHRHPPGHGRGDDSAQHPGLQLGRKPRQKARSVEAKRVNRSKATRF